MWHRKAMDKEIIKAMATKFSEIFAISMLKKHRKFCRHGLTHLDATLAFKNRPNTYAPPCTNDQNFLEPKISINFEYIVLFLFLLQFKF